jgi:hypothetical protein
MSKLYPGAATPVIYTECYTSECRRKVSSKAKSDANGTTSTRFSSQDGGEVDTELPVAVDRYPPYLPSLLFDTLSLYFTHKNSAVDITTKKYIKLASVACVYVWASVLLANVCEQVSYWQMCVSKCLTGKCVWASVLLESVCEQVSYWKMCVSKCLTGKCVWASVLLANVTQSQRDCKCVSRLVAGLLPQRFGLCSCSSHVGGQIDTGTGLWSGYSVFPC